MKRKSLSLFILALLGILLVFFWIPSNRSLLSGGEVRAAIDIGSGGSNLKIAKVDPETNKIITELYSQTVPVFYQKHLEQSSNETFDSEVQAEGIRAIQSFKEIANSYHAKKIVAVATAAFRKAKNASEFVKKIELKTGVKVRIINQDEEGILAFRAALANTHVKPEDLLTWDIGGGSMQLTTLTKEGTYLVEKGKTASVPFRNAVIEQIEHKDPKTTNSPNPMSIEEMQASINLSAQFAQNINPYIKEKLVHPTTQILAVGNLFYNGIRTVVNNSTVYQSALEKDVMKMAGKTDAELPGGSVVDVTVTNPLLVLGYMKELQIQKVEVIQINNTDGALTYPAYWQE